MRAHLLEQFVLECPINFGTVHEVRPQTTCLQTAHCCGTTLLSKFFLITLQNKCGGLYERPFCRHCVNITLTGQSDNRKQTAGVPFIKPHGHRPACTDMSLRPWCWLVCSPQRKIKLNKKWVTPACYK
jgi:hypothetical protein